MNIIKIHCNNIFDWFIDKYFNINTVKSVKLKEHDNVINFMYEPLPYLQINKIFKKYPLKSDDHLIDFGCGKGRILAIAVKNGCKNIYGIDINQSLLEIAQNNFNNMDKRFSDVNYELLCIDAKKYTFHPDINKVFFYNPFQLKVFIYTFKALIRSLKEYPRNVTVYFCGAQPSVIKQFEKLNCFQLIGKDEKNRFFIYESIQGENINECFGN